jgi:magnesium transporter
MGDGISPAAELLAAWPSMTSDERFEAFRHIDRAEAGGFFLGLSTSDQVAVLHRVKLGERQVWLRLLAPDDAVDVVQHLPAEERQGFLELLDEGTRREVAALLAYAEDAAGGLMSPRFARLRPEMTVGEAIRYLQRQVQARLETIYLAYVLDPEQRLCGVVSFRELLAASADSPLAGVMRTEVISVQASMDQELVARIMARHNLSAIPVLDAAGRMQGIVTVDDIVDVVEEAATEDIQKLGGMQALDTTYLETGLLSMVRKRAGWLAALFLGEMLTASAMGHYENEIAKAVVLALFIPLIISSGGNSGSQATTLVIRAMALGEVTTGDWWRIVRRELLVGICLGLILALIGLVRILAWQEMFHTYGAYANRVAVTVAFSLLGVVTWGTLAGSMLPFVIRRLGFDPASASAPFVATLVDVSGLVIYFNVAQLMLGGSLL